MCGLAFLCGARGTVELGIGTFGGAGAEVALVGLGSGSERSVVVAGNTAGTLSG